MKNIVIILLTILLVLSVLFILLRAGKTSTPINTLTDPDPVIQEIPAEPVSPKVDIPEEEPTQVEEVEGRALSDVKYTLPESWKVEIRGDKSNPEGIMFSAKSGGGYFFLTVAKYDMSGRRAFFCKVKNVCIDATYFDPVQIGNIEGYRANAIDNSGGGSIYFGSKGTKFYILDSFNPPSPNDFEKHRDEFLASLEF